MKDVIKQKVTQQRYTILFFVIISIYHVLMNVNFGDDMHFANVLADGQQSIWEYVVYRYNHWSSRLGIEMILPYICRLPLLWKILDIFIWTGIYQMMRSLLELDEQKECGLLLLAMVCYPFYHMGSAGWIATALNYVWPFVAVLAVCVLVKRYLIGGQLHVWEYLLMFVLIVIGGNQEQSAAILTAVLVYAFVWCLIKKRSCMLISGINLLLGTGCLIFHMTAPGNAERTLLEGDMYFPHFSELSVIDKGLLGLLRVCNVFVDEWNIVFLLFVAVVLFVILRLYRTRMNMVFSAVVVLILFCYKIPSGFFPGMKKWFDAPEQIYSIKTNTAFWVALFSLICLIVSLLWFLWQITERNWEKYLFCLIVLGAGFASNVVIGFSPTIYASNYRTSFYLFQVLIFMTGYIAHQGNQAFHMNKKASVAVNMGMIFAGVIVLYKYMSITATLGQ